MTTTSTASQDSSRPGSQPGAAGGQIGLKSGSKLGKYEIVGRLGLGGMALVYKAYDPLLDRFVAVKQIASHLAADAKFMERFRKEAQILAKLAADQASVVQIYELIEDPRGLFIVMEYVEGQTLDVLMSKQKGPMPVQFALEVLWHLAVGLRMVHDKKIIHRDLKPANVLVGVNHRCKITDFGVAARSGGKTSMTLGTTKYMAPELFGGDEVDGRADLYSLGCIVYEMLTGPEKFNQVFKDIVRDPQAESLRWMKWHTSRELMAPLLDQVNPQVPEVLGKIVAKMMAKNPAQRFGSVDNLLEILKRHFTQQGQAKKVVDAKRKAAAKGQAAAVAERRPEPIPDRSAEAAAAAGAVAAVAAVPAVALPSDSPKTTVLPKRKMTRRQRLTVLGSLLGVIMVVMGCFFFVDWRKKDRIRTEALNRYAEARTFFDGGDYPKALAALGQLQDDPKLGATKPGREWAPLLRALIDGRQAVSRRDWASAEAAAKRMNDLAAPMDPAEVRDFMARIRSFEKGLQVEKAFWQRLDEADVAMDAGLKNLDPAQFEKAQELLRQAEALNPRFGLDPYWSKLTKQGKRYDYQVLFNKGVDIEAARPDEAEKIYKQALVVLPTPEVKVKLAELDKKRRYKDLMAKGDDAVRKNNSTEALKDYAAALDLVPSDELAALIKKVRARDEYAKGVDAFNKGAQVTAQMWWKKAVEDDPSLQAQIDGYLAQIKNRKDYDVAIALVAKAESEGKLDEVIKYLLEARKLTSDTAVQKGFDVKIQTCRFQLKFAEATKALAAGDWTKAENALKDARRIAEAAGDKPAVDRVDAQLKQMNVDKDYLTRKTAGDKQFLAQEFDKAHEEYKKAKTVLITAGRPTKEIEDLLKKTDYNLFLLNGKTDKARSQYPAALSWFKQAQGIDDTEEVRGLIEEVERRMKAEAPKEPT